MINAMARTYTAEEVDAAVERLQAPGRLDHASDVVTHAAPSLARVLDSSLHAGGWYDSGHEQQLAEAALVPEEERIDALRELVADNTRLGMLVGVAVGFELARELAAADAEPTTEGS
jgi:hypothetical protein